MENPNRTRLTKSEGRKFAFPVGVAFLVLSGVAGWRGHPAIAAIFLGMAVVLLFLGLIIPTRLGPVFRAWMRIALLISKITTPVFMGVVFFLVITPTGLVMRLTGRNPLLHEPDGDSYWATRSANRRTTDLHRQF